MTSQPLNQNSLSFKVFANFTDVTKILIILIKTTYKDSKRQTSKKRGKIHFLLAFPYVAKRLISGGKKS